MSKLFIKLLLAGCPLLIVLGMYICTDPFGVIYNYPVLYDTAKKIEIYRNRDYASTEVFLRQYDKHKYDSYIFGSSRSETFEMTEWSKHINSTAYFHYAAHCESLYGVERKIDFLHRKGVKIRNALFIVDQELLAVTNNFSESILRKHPLISGESELSFQLAEFKPYIFLFFKPDNIKWLLIGKKHPQIFKEETNEFLWWCNYEAGIIKNRDSFYALREGKFYDRPATQQYTTHVIKEEQIKLLTNIKRIMDADSTDYRIAINPLYDQKKMDTTDLRLLESIFGSNSVFDFSGINEITQSKYNYYDISHYRRHIANRMMDSIYSK